MVITTKESLEFRIKTFNPELIIEVTSACNRACVGCYAPNVVTNKTASELYSEAPDLFLSISNLNRAFGEMSYFPGLTSMRGGEPSLHPELSTLLLITARHSEQVILETHARWLLPENLNNYQELINAIFSLNIIVKISFDKMHNLKSEDLQLITNFLEMRKIEYRIAITEDTMTNFLITRNQCIWVEDSRIIYQPKATNASELIVPAVGVINTSGRFIESVTSKLTFGEAL